MLVTHRLLDVTPLGRQEGGEDFRYHDKYDTETEKKACH